ncbi:N-acetyl-gamma-glutamyl-phosphate reductase [Bacillus sp. FJAT-27225]|uniref:N-acetyl-gamma-glutamyl-phosphate reductase n=1 Tax=Bacillus sp. FJAT-27225 TaxID=1743144 RepID=UPI00080C2AEB|nr:N-acetyl-gamma-glutamyl-phosphate reductase [Bacillus sp. FJAT-27225]OCA83308.1 N-acetyl-gamma-glutamyl-phosphate reductase [Bacillus sp. FJAT-27225]
MRAAVIGGTGYSAIELIRLLDKHPVLEVGPIISSSSAGTELSSVFPHTGELLDLRMGSFDAKKITESSEIAFLAVPPGISQSLIPQLVENGIKCIDLSGDLRLKSPGQYEEWYKQTPAEPKLIAEAVYGLSELYSEEIKNASIIANPGCYPTASLLGLMPVIKSGLADTGSIIIDAKSGVSGAGRGVSLATHFSEINENMKAYKLGTHQHIPEIEQILTEQSGREITVTFTAHLAPMTRGILATIYVNLSQAISTKEIIELYQEFYAGHPFIRIRDEGSLPATKEVSGSNFCDIGLFSDKRTGRLTIVSVIDNLMKGAAGQAIQNANLMNGWDIRAGLYDIPHYP